MPILSRGEPRGARPPRSREGGDDPIVELSVSVHAPGKTPRSAGELRALAEFMRRHDGVEAVLHDAPRGTIVVRYDERKGAGAFLRGALLDRVHATQPLRVVEPRRVEVTIAHELPG